jgi:hypothetical protein
MENRNENLSFFLQKLQKGKQEFNENFVIAETFFCPQL